MLSRSSAYVLNVVVGFVYYGLGTTNFDVNAARNARAVN